MLNVIKIGGALLNNEKLFEASIQKFCDVTGPKILVHGGGRTASDWMEQIGLKPKMIEGRRITDDATIEIVSLVYAGLNKKIVATLQAHGLNAIGLTGADENVVIATKRPPNPIDYGWVGDIGKTGVNEKVFIGYIQHQIVPVMAPLTHDGKGQLLNTNADTLGSVIAQAIAAKMDVRLIYLFEKPGVLKDVDNDESVIKELRLSEFEAMKTNGEIHSGMIPKLQNGFDALKNGVKEVVICHPNELEKLTVKTSLIL